MTVTPIYAALLALFYVVLSFRVIGVRRGQRISLGDGGSKMLLRRQRVHGNFAEYVPFALVLMLLAELQGAARPLLHAMGLALVVGRLLHAIGVGSEPDRLPLRVAGMVLTFAVLVTGAVVNLTSGGGLAVLGR